MAATDRLTTYSDSSRKEDVLDVVEILTAQEDWFLNNLGTTVATDTIHETMTDTLRSPGSNAVAEQEDYDVQSSSTPSRLTNLVQLVAIPFSVSNTQKEIKKHTGQDEMARQTVKALKDWGNSAEYDLVRSTLASGASGTAPQMSGVIEAISKSSNYTAHSSVDFSSSILKGLMRDNWDNSNGDVATEIFVGSHLSDKMDEFTNKSDVVVTGDQKRIVKSVSTFETGMGTVNKHTHRYVFQSGDGTDRVLAVRPEKLKIAYLTPPYIQDNKPASSGDYVSKTVIGKLTLEVRNQDSCWFAEGFNT